MFRRVCIVHHSGYGHTARQAAAVAEGVRTVDDVACIELTVADLADSDAAGWWADRLAAGFTKSGSQHGDKQNTLVGFATFAAQHGMHWVNLNLLPGNNSAVGNRMAVDS